MFSDNFYTQKLALGKDRNKCIKHEFQNHVLKLKYMFGLECNSIQFKSFSLECCIYIVAMCVLYEGLPSSIITALNI